MKTVLITGTSSGIGKASAKKFNKEGWNVIATMRTPEKETELKNSDTMLVVRLDVVDKKSIEDAITSGIEKFGKIDAIVNNAGVGLYGAFEPATDKQIRHEFDVNVFGVMDAIRAILPHFRKNGIGTIVNISSQGGRMTFPFCSLYHATKFAIEGFTESLSLELEPLNIHAKLVEPGMVETDFGGSATLTEDKEIDMYAGLQDLVMGNLSGMEPLPTPVEGIAEVVFDAASDPSNRVRYLAGKDAEYVINAKKTMGDQEYMEFLKRRYGLPTAKPESSK